MRTSVRNPCCEISDVEGSSVVDRLLEIQEFAASNKKRAAWTDCLKCLRILEQRSDVLQFTRGPYSDDEKARFVAVSHRWDDKSISEGNYRYTYRINGYSGRYLRQNEVQDNVIFRVIRYAKYHKIDRIWIDKECSPQKESKAKQIAMDSMDLVYRGSNYPVGLLTIRLETQDEVNTLQDLMEGHFVAWRKVDEYPQLRYHTHGQRSQTVLKMLRHLHTDEWWTRAWIFQEEYLSSIDMYLLIRHKPGLVAGRKYGILPGEICVNAAEFRKHATLFLLAFKHESRNRLSKKCAKLLKTFGRYNIQYHFQHDAKRKAMSPRIFADINRRKIYRSSDKLPIIANSCDYAIRLRPKVLSKGRHRLELCLLALFLLNGEIIRNARNIKKLPTEMGLSNYLHYISFNKFEPPVAGQHLAYLKKCRFPEVSLCPLGISTKGYLWKVIRTIDTHTWSIPRAHVNESHSARLNDHQRGRLYQLVCNLQNYGSLFQFLAEEIMAYLEQDRHSDKSTPTKKQNDLMAKSIAEAIDTGMPLQIACIRGSIEAGAVFVGLKDPEMNVFTSWSNGRCRDGRNRQTHVLLGVELEETNDGLLLETVQWVNGLAFFKQKKRISVIFRWPSVWMRKVVAGTCQ